MIPHAIGAIFDLDGVLVDTASCHYACWRRLAAEFGRDFSPAQGEGTKGVSRDEALAYVLDVCGIVVPDDQLAELARRKDAWYKSMIAALNPSNLLPGALETLTWLRARRVPTALASSSENAREILRRTETTDYFDAIVDGHMVRRTKPDPEIFVLAADRLGLPPSRCLVVEDAVAGVAGARAAGCRVAGVGSPAVLVDADLVVPTVGDLPLAAIFVDLPTPQL